MFFSSERIRKNYESNRLADTGAAADRRGLLNGQGRPMLSGMRFGRSDVGRAGCESIAVYNAMLLLGRPRPLAEIIRDMEKGGYLRFGGRLGATPYLQRLLRRYGASARFVLPARLRREAGEGVLPPGAVFLMVIWNRFALPHKGLHTFAVEYSPDGTGGWMVYNRFNSDSAGRRYDTLDGILKNGRYNGAFFMIWRVERRKDGQ